MKCIQSIISKSSFVLLAVTLSTISATARSMQTRLDLRAQLIEINLDPKLNLGSISGGTIQVKYDMFDKQENFIQLEINRQFHCPEDRMCAQVMPAPYIVKIPLIKMDKDVCGIVTYKGQRDQRPADGAFYEITVTDNTRNTCPHLMYLLPLASTEVEYRMITAGFGAPIIKTVSKMTAEKLN